MYTCLYMSLHRAIDQERREAVAEKRAEEEDAVLIPPKSNLDSKPCSALQFLTQDDKSFAEFLVDLQSSASIFLASLCQPLPNTAETSQPASVRQRSQVLSIAHQRINIPDANAGER